MNASKTSPCKIHNGLSGIDEGEPLALRSDSPHGIVSAAAPSLRAAETLRSEYAFTFVQCTHELRTTPRLHPEPHEDVPHLPARDAYGAAPGRGQALYHGDRALH